MLNKSGIYQILNVINGKRYIGSAVNFKARWRLHKHQLNSNKHHSILLQRAWNKYGIESFKFEIMLICEKEDLIKKEQCQLDLFKPEYNICKVAGSSLGIYHKEETKLKISNFRKGKDNHQTGRKHTPESLLKIRLSSKGRVASKETRAKMSAARKGIPTNYNPSKETREKMRLAKLGKTHTPEQKAYQSERQTGRKMSEESVAKSAASRTGKKRSAEQRSRMSESHKGKKQTQEQIKKRIEAVRNTKLNRLSKLVFVRDIEWEGDK